MFRYIFTEHSTKRFFAQPLGHMNNEEMLMVDRRHTLEAIFQVMRVAVNYRKRQKQIDIIIALYLKSTLSRPPIYDEACPEKLWTASPGNPVGLTKPSLILLFVQPDKKTLEESKSLREPNFWQFLAKNPWEKFPRSRNLNQNPLLYTMLFIFFNSSDMHYFEAHWTR